MKNLREATEERHRKILDLVRSGVNQVPEIAQVLAVSASTIRRDLSVLQSSGILARTYGGASMLSPFMERSVDENVNIQFSQKVEIAKKAATFVADNSTVFIDAGSTCNFLAERLIHHKKLTVVTRGLEIATTLASARNVKLVMIGGLMRPLSHGLVGPLAEIAIQRLHFDLAFFGADAVDSRLGLGEPTIEELSIKEKVAERSDKIYVLADSAKLAHSKPPAWSFLDTFWTLITDEAPPQAVRELKARGIDVLRTSD